MVTNSLVWKKFAIAGVLCIVLLSIVPPTTAVTNDDVEIYISSEFPKVKDNPDAASLGHGLFIYIINHLNEPLGIYIQWDFSTLFQRSPIESYQWRYVHGCDANGTSSSFSSTGTPFPCRLTITVQANDIKYVSRSGFIFLRWIYFPAVQEMEG
jgi:hypothetical protein